MAHEGAKQFVFSLERPAVVARGAHQRVEIEGSEVCQGVHFEIAPDVFDGIEFGCVGREEMRMQARVVRKKLAGALRAMGLKTVPNQGDGSGELLEEHAKEMDDSTRIDVGVGVKPKIQVEILPLGRYAKCRNHRHFLMRARTLIEQRRLASWTPRAANQGRHRHATFVDKDEPRLQARGFFLMQGHSVLTQPSMKSSSRSTARRAGFWGLQPNEWSKRPIWST